MVESGQQPEASLASWWGDPQAVRDLPQLHRFYVFRSGVPDSSRPSKVP